MSRPKNKARKGRALRRYVALLAVPRRAEPPLDRRIQELERFILNAEERRARAHRPGYLPPLEGEQPVTRRTRGLRSTEAERISAHRTVLWLGIGFFGTACAALAAWLAVRLAAM